ncbi:MAG: 4a-hydroxytetrahydrobiopterin dehydratase [Actinomycetota bacterium]
MGTEDLLSRRCEACEAGTLPIDETRAAELQEHLDPSWSREANRSIERTFRFRNFLDPFGLATRIALVAESEGHHPDFEIAWGRLRVFLTTHAAKGLTDNDFIMAAKIDQVAAGTGIRES